MYSTNVNIVQCQLFICLTINSVYSSKTEFLLIVLYCVYSITYTMYSPVTAHYASFVLARLITMLERAIANDRSVCLSVCLFVCPSVRTSVRPPHS